jgi:hypothetical protein
VIREQVMGLGSFDISLRPDTPSAIRNELLLIDNCALGHLVITPVQVADPTISFATLKTIARWAGVIRKRGGLANEVISGVGLGFWVADEDGKDSWGSGSGLFAFGVTNFSAVAVLAHPAALTLGSITNIVTPDPYFRNNVDNSRQDALDHACAHWGAEYIVRPNFSVDYGPVATLWPTTTTPDVVLLGTGNGFDGGREVSLTGMLAAVESSRDVEDFSTFILLTGNGTFGTAGGTDPVLKDPLGGAVTLRRIVSDSLADSNNTATAAAQQLAIWNTIRSQLTVTVDPACDAGADIICGDTVWIYAPDNGVFNPANQVTYRGSVLLPEAHRVVGMTWGPSPNMGVYYVPPDANKEVVDLTNWVAFESAGMTLDVGASDRGMPFSRSTSRVLAGPL